MSGNGGGKSGAELRAEADQQRDATLTVTRCVCGWEYEGTAAEGRELAKGHRRVHHPELKPVRRKRGSLIRHTASDETDLREGRENARKVAASLARLEDAS
jgi:hypothetical protein